MNFYIPLFGLYNIYWILDIQWHIFYIYSSKNFIYISDPPGPPVNLKSTAVGADFTILEWKPPRSDGGTKITHYVIQKREKKSDDRQRVSTVESHLLTDKVTGLKENVDYYFSVCATNTVGTSAPCDMDQPVTPVKELRKSSETCFIYLIYSMCLLLCSIFVLLYITFGFIKLQF